MPDITCRISLRKKSYTYLYSLITIFLKDLLIYTLSYSTDTKIELIVKKMYYKTRY